MPYNLGPNPTNDTVQHDNHPNHHAALANAVNDINRRITGGVLASGWWDYNISVTPPPISGQVRTAPEPPVVGSPYTIWLSARDNDGLYWENLSLGMLPGDEIRLRGTAGAVQHCTVTSTQLTIPGNAGYATILTVLTAATGSIAKTARVEVALIRPQGA